MSTQAQYKSPQYEGSGYFLFPHGEVKEGKAIAAGSDEFGEEDKIKTAYFPYSDRDDIFIRYLIGNSIWHFERTDDKYYIRNEYNQYLAIDDNGQACMGSLQNAVEFYVENDEKDSNHICIFPCKTGIYGFPNDLDIVNSKDCIIEVNGIKYLIYKNSKKATVIPKEHYSATDSQYEGEVVIPEIFDYDGNEYTVTDVKPGVFAECKNITRVSLPKSVKKITDCCFSLSSALSSVEVPSVSTIGDGAFRGCSGLTAVDFPMVSTIGDNAFF